MAGACPLDEGTALHCAALPSTALHSTLSSVCPLCLCHLLCAPPTPPWGAFHALPSAPSLAGALVDASVSSPVPSKARRTWTQMPTLRQMLFLQDVQPPPQQQQPGVEGHSTHNLTVPSGSSLIGIDYRRSQG